MWAQRARINNFLYKDLTTKYFFLLTRVRHARSSTRMLQDKDGIWHSTPEAIHKVVTDPFQTFFQSRRVSRYSCNSLLAHPATSPDLSSWIVRWI